MAKAPAFQFYVKDWLSDPELQSASSASRGIWINALCYMWEARERGVIQGTVESLSRILNCTVEEFHKFLEESRVYGFDDLVTHTNGKVTLTNRRMQREEKERKQHSIRQHRYTDRHKAPSNDGKSDAEMTHPSPSSSPSPIQKDFAQSGKPVENPLMVEYKFCHQPYGVKEEHTCKS